MVEEENKSESFKKDEQVAEDLLHFSKQLIAELESDSTDSKKFKVNPNNSGILIHLQRIEQLIQDKDFYQDLVVSLNVIGNFLQSEPSLESWLMKFVPFRFYFHPQVMKAPEMFSILEIHQIKEMLSGYESFLKQKDSFSVKQKSVFFDSIFNLHSADVRTDLETTGLSNQDLQELNSDPFILRTLKTLMTRPEQFSFQIAFLLRRIKNEDILSDARKVLNVKPVNARIHFTEAYYKWTLCTDAEKKLLISLENKNVLLLTDDDGEALILLKFEGKFAGVVLRSFQTPSGEIIPRGLLISPTDFELRAKLRESFDVNRTKIKLSYFEGNWAFMRGISSDNFPAEKKVVSFEELIDKALKVKEAKSYLWGVKIPGAFTSYFHKRVREKRTENN